MRTVHITLILGLVCAGAAHADISDSGSLVLGQQAVIGSTMTVRGQDASGNSLNVSSSVVVGGCIKFPGGDQCAPSSGGSGDALLNSTQTWSGANTFTSTITVGPGPSYITTASYAALVKGVWSVVAFASFTASAGETFSGLSSSYSYRINLRSQQNTSDAYLYLRVNGDTGNNFKMHVSAHNSAGGVDSYAYDGREWCVVSGAGYTNAFTKAGYGIIAVIDCDVQPGDHSRVYCHTNESHLTTTGYGEHGEASCYYDGAQSLYSLSIGPSAGTMTGYATLQALWNPSVQ